MIATTAIAVAALAAPMVDPPPATGGTAVYDTGSAPYSLVGVGDSILVPVLDHLEHPNALLIAEPCRAPYTPGCDDRASHVDELADLVERSAAGGYVLVQDGGRGDRDGEPVTDVDWVRFILDVHLIVPDDRTIVWIHPASLQSPEATVEAHRRRGYAEVVFAALDRDVVYVDTPITRLGDDGLHLTPDGAYWLAAAIEAAVDSP